MTTFRAHFDGQVLVPDTPITLPTNCPLEVRVDTVEPAPSNEDLLADLAELAKTFPAANDWPADGAEQLDHYLYGLPKRS